MTTLAEFYSRKDLVRYYQTLEIYHPTIGVIRYVSGRQEPLDFTLEDDAPRNAGESVTFEGGYFKYTKPAQGEPDVTVEIQLGRVGTAIKQQLKSIKGASRALHGEVVLREYIGGQLGAPIYVVRLDISAIALTADGAAIKADADNGGDYRASEYYTSDRFPGLAESL